MVERQVRLDEALALAQRMAGKERSTEQHVTELGEQVTFLGEDTAYYADPAGDRVWVLRALDDRVIGFQAFVPAGLGGSAAWIERRRRALLVMASITMLVLGVAGSVLALTSSLAERSSALAVVVCCGAAAALLWRSGTACLGERLRQ